MSACKQMERPMTSTSSRGLDDGPENHGLDLLAEVNLKDFQAAPQSATTVSVLDTALAGGSTQRRAYRTGWDSCIQVRQQVSPTHRYTNIPPKCPRGLARQVSWLRDG